MHLYLYKQEQCGRTYPFYDLCIIYLVLITYLVLSMYLFLIQKTPNKEKIKGKDFNP